MTSRELVKRPDTLSSLKIGTKIVQALVQLIGKSSLRQGGITSSNAATRGIGTRRARILGEANIDVQFEYAMRSRPLSLNILYGNGGLVTRWPIS